VTLPKEKNMFDWNNKKHCKKCNEERAVRFCLRKDKDYGWSCCNELRSDGKCPPACPYTPKHSDAQTAFPAIKADSKKELLDFVERYLQLWIHKPMEQLNGAVPHQLSLTDEGRARLTDWLSGFSYPDPRLIIKLNEKLSLQLAVPKPQFNDIEQLTADYLDTLITQDWDRLIAMHTLYPEYQQPDNLERIVRYLAKHPLLKKITRWTLINAGYAEDRSQAFVFCELNGKENWTMVYANQQDCWQIYQLIRGTVQDYFAQKQLFRELAVALSQGNETISWEKLKEADKRFVLNADVEYYRGLYYLMLKQPDKAKESWLDAVAFDPTWTPALFNLALLDMQEKQFEAAIVRLKQVILLKPDDLTAMNNLAVCHLGLQQTDQAISIWQEILTLDPEHELAKRNLEHLQIHV
jgi:hypothetical protein